MMQTNLQLDLAFNYLENTGTNIFLTGKAGTGNAEWQTIIAEQEHLPEWRRLMREG